MFRARASEALASDPRRCCLLPPPRGKLGERMFASDDFVGDLGACEGAGDWDGLEFVSGAPGRWAHPSTRDHAIGVDVE